MERKCETKNKDFLLKQKLNAEVFTLFKELALVEISVRKPRI